MYRNYERMLKNSEEKCTEDEIYILVQSVQSRKRTNTRARDQTDREYKQENNRKPGEAWDRPRRPRDESGWFLGEQERFPLQI